MSIKKEWILTDQPSVDLVEKLAEETKYSSAFIKLCLQRGLDSKEKIECFLSPDQTWLHDPYDFFEMEKTYNRIFSAVESGELITIYGDYDADGVTSTTIMYEALETLGAQVNYYIPDRFKDGYGPNEQVFNRLIEEGTQLILTVDNGVAGHDAIKFAMNNGVDVIVTDHHDLPDELPKAYSIIHPRHPNGSYPFGDLSGAGVALKLAQALLEDLPVEMLDLVAIGTIADLVSLTDENRAIAKFGIDMLKQSQRPGLLQLLKKLEVEFESITDQTIGFKIGPILNAVGRLEKADKAVDLLLTFDFEEADKLAEDLIDINEERKSIGANIEKDVKEILSNDPGDNQVIILSSPDWHEGVLGIVASKVVREFGKPTILLKEDVDSGVLKGSGRSVEGFSMFEAGNNNRHLFVNFGGHEMAAGMTLNKDQLDDLKTAFVQEMTKQTQGQTLKPSLSVDLELEVDEINLESIQEIEKLAPFGTDNSRPLVKLSSSRVDNYRVIGRDKSHLKLNVSGGSSQLDVIGFGLADFAELLNIDSKISQVGKLDINEWNGNKKPQFMLEDLNVDGPIIIDKRTRKLNEKIFEQTNTHFICFNKKVYNFSEKHIDDSSTLELIDDGEVNITSDKEQIAFIDCPPSLDLLKEVLLKISDRRIVIHFYSLFDIYAKGMPTREDFKKVYKYFVKHKQLPAEGLAKKIGPYLKIEPLFINLIINVFLELQFVKIEDGIIMITKSDSNYNIKDTKTYNEYYKMYHAEEVLYYSSLNELSSIFSKWMEEETEE